MAGTVCLSEPLAQRPGRLVGLLLCTAAVVLIAAGKQSDPASVHSASEAGPSTATGTPNAGRLIRIPLPITGTVDTRVKRAVDHVLSELPQDGSRPILVFEFWSPPHEDGRGSEFERSLALARFLASDRLSRVRTVAYLPRSVVGHAVLVAIACEEIIMAPDAELGQAGLDESGIDPTIRRGYSEIADRRRTIPAPVALGMLDADLTVFKVKTAAGTRYVLEDERENLQREGILLQADRLIPPAEMGRFSGTQLRLDHSFVSHLVSDRRQLAAALNLSARQLEPDPSLGDQWHPIRVELVGPITAQTVGHAQRAIQERMRAESVNFVCLWIDSPGGSSEESIRLANFLADMDSAKVRTVAYVAGEARSDAALIALACDHVVMNESAVLGGPGAETFDEAKTRAVSEAIRQLAAQKSRRWSLPRAMIDPQLVVHRYTLRGTEVSEYFCQEELADQTDPDRWSQGEQVTTPGKPLSVEGSRAESLGLARATVESFTEFKALYDLESDPELVQPSWAHSLVDALAAPHVAATLLFFAGFALIAELMSPGISAGAFVSTVCFALYFWSQYLHGTAGWLEIVLFLTGVGCLAVELFVLPGFGIFGLGGGALIVASLVLASQTFILPRNEYEFHQFPRSLFMVAASGGGVIAGLVMLRRYLHRAPLIRRVVLAPPEGEELDERGRRESLVDFRHLIGQQGLTTTPLTPSGKARFGQQRIDVITEGMAVPRGATVVVVEVLGNRVIVQPVDSPTDD
jgi:membrane-bound ClpP family serine protease